MNYPVRWLGRFLPRTVAAILVFLVSLLIIIALAITLGLVILAQGQQLIDKVIQIGNSVDSLVKQLEVFLQTRNLQVNLNFIAELIRKLALSIISYILSILVYFSRYKTT